MKIIIAKDSIKREVRAPFDICLSSKDAERLIDLLQRYVSGGGTYGWVEIFDRPPMQGSPNTPPLKWDE